MISPNAMDGAEVTHFKITFVTGGTLFKTDGITPIMPGGFITAGEGAAGLRYLPATNTFGAGLVSVQASASASNAGVSGDPATAVVNIYPAADTPNISNAFTNVNQQTTSGLVIARNPVDGAEVTHFQITAISGGQLFHADGVSPIDVNGFITFAQGTPAWRSRRAPDRSRSGTSRCARRCSRLSPAGRRHRHRRHRHQRAARLYDDPIVAGVTVIRVVHLTELRTRVNTQRVRFGLAEIALHTPVAGVTVIAAQQLLKSVTR